MLRGIRESKVWTTFRSNRSAVVGLWILGLIVAIALLAPLLAPEDPIAQNLALRRQPPSWNAWFGRDGFGRDILSRAMFGARSTLLAATGAVALSATVGSLIGITAGFKQGFIDGLFMRSMDLVLSFPYFLLAILIIAIAGPGLANAAIAIAIAYIPQYARVVRGAALEVKQSEYIEAARAAGIGDTRIILTHVLPNVTAPIIVLSTVGMALAITGVAALSFLGLGARPPSPEWGAMLAEGREFITTAPHITFFPGLSILLAVLALNLVGDGMRDTFDPRLQ
jgi:peptide/nickel transport system permease protein